MPPPPDLCPHPRPHPPTAQDLDPLASLPRLKYLSLLDNPVAQRPGYRLHVIARCKALKMLDFRKVKQQVRGGAGRLACTPAHLCACAAARHAPACCRACAGAARHWLTAALPAATGAGGGGARARRGAAAGRADV